MRWRIRFSKKVGFELRVKQWKMIEGDRADTIYHMWRILILCGSDILVTSQSRSRTYLSAPAEWHCLINISKSFILPHWDTNGRFFKPWKWIFSPVFGQWSQWRSEADAGGADRTRRQLARGGKRAILKKSRENADCKFFYVFAYACNKEKALQSARTYRRL